MRENEGKWGENEGNENRSSQNIWWFGVMFIFQIVIFKDGNYWVFIWVLFSIFSIRVTDISGFVFFSIYILIEYVFSFVTWNNVSFLSFRVSMIREMMILTLYITQMCLCVSACVCGCIFLVCVYCMFYKP